MGAVSERELGGRWRREMGERKGGGKEREVWGERRRKGGGGGVSLNSDGRLLY